MFSVSAPDSFAIGSVKIMPASKTIIPANIIEYKQKFNTPLTSFVFSSPKSLAITLLPPMPKTEAIDIIIKRSGVQSVTAAIIAGSFVRETKKVSAIL